MKIFLNERFNVGNIFSRAFRLKSLLTVLLFESSLYNISDIHDSFAALCHGIPAHILRVRNCPTARQFLTVGAVLDYHLLR